MQNHPSRFALISLYAHEPLSGAHGTAPRYTLGAAMPDISVADVSNPLRGEWLRGPGAASNTAVAPRGLAWKAFPPASLQQWATRFGARRLASGCILRASARSGQRAYRAVQNVTEGGNVEPFKM